LLGEAGLPDGFAVTLHTTNSRAAMLSSANAIAGQLAKIGIEVRVTEHAPETYWSQVHDSEPFVVTCRAGAQFAEWAQNAAGAWPDPAFADELATALALTDAQSRRVALANLQRTVAAGGTEAVWGFADALDAARPDVRDLPTGAGLARMMLDGVWLAR
jgi:ABC-type transport system substrate-binding protein